MSCRNHVTLKHSEKFSTAQEDQHHNGRMNKSNDNDGDIFITMMMMMIMIIMTMSIILNIKQNLQETKQTNKM